MATTYASAATCTVEVTFTPQFAGLRKGAIVFFSGSSGTGTALGSALIYGTGTGPQIAYNAPTPVISTFFNTIFSIAIAGDAPANVAVDNAGDFFFVFFSTFTNGVIEKVPPSGGNWTVFYPTVNGLTLNHPCGLAVDGAGNLYISDSGNNRVLVAPPTDSTPFAFAPIVNGLGLNGCGGLALDGAGDLFIGDTGNNRVVEIPVGGSAAIAISPTIGGVGLLNPSGVAIDSSGNLFIADSGNNRIVKVPADGGAATAIDPTVDGTSLNLPQGVTVDGAGDLYILDTNNSRLVEVSADGGPEIVLFDSQAASVSVAIDSVGDLYLAQYDSQGQFYVGFVPRSQLPALNFPTVTNPGSIDTADGVQSVPLQNIGNEALALTVSYPPDFPEASGVSGSCASSASLNPGRACKASVEFAPQGSDQNGAINESLTLTDNALNVTGAIQSIAVSGTAGTAAMLTSPTPGSVFAGPNVTFTWSAVSGATGYTLLLGSVGVGSGNVYTSFEVTATSVTVTGLPVRIGSPGSNPFTIYARLITYFGTAQTFTDYVYTPATQAGIASPSPGTMLSGASTTFTWTTGTGATGYYLWLGSTGVGSNNLYQSAQLTVTSITVNGLPTNGETIYARLITSFNGVLASVDYAYTAAPTALTSPTPGSTLTGSSATFTWTAATSVTAFDLWLGFNGAGSSDLFASGVTTATSATVTGPPTKGATIYARLYYEVSGVWYHTDYTYAEATSTAATMISPLQGATLGSSNVVFSWTAGALVTNYALWLGTSEPGSSNLYASPLSPALSVTVPKLPAKGAKVYARLYSEGSGGIQYVDYTYTEQ